MTRVLWIGDAGASTGFEHCTRAAVEAMLRANWDVHVLGINYGGDPHDYGCDLYPAARVMRPEDVFGTVRAGNLVRKLRPDAVVILQDPWNIPDYMVSIRRVDARVPVVGWLAVDGKNCRGTSLSPPRARSTFAAIHEVLAKANLLTPFTSISEVGDALRPLIGEDPAALDHSLALAVFWTRFAQEQAKKGGYLGHSAVVQLGVDLDVFCDQGRSESRKRLKLPQKVQDSFIVGVVGRNQPRKRLDLAVSYFAEWVKTRMIDDAVLLMHVAPTADDGWDLKQLREYYGLHGQLMVSEAEVGLGITEVELASVYSAFDCLLTTTQGEGWGLPIAEAMACGVPCIVPDWSGLGEWTENAALKVKCTEIAHTPNTINAQGGIPDRRETIKALDLLYSSHEERERLRDLGLSLVRRSEFRWENVGDRIVRCIESVLQAKAEVVEMRAAS